MKKLIAYREEEVQPLSVDPCLKRRCSHPKWSSGPVCESRGGRPGLPVPNKPDGLCGRKATLKRNRERWIYICHPEGRTFSRSLTLNGEGWIYICHPAGCTRPFRIIDIKRRKLDLHLPPSGTHPFSVFARLEVAGG